MNEEVLIGVMADRVTVSSDSQETTIALIGAMKRGQPKTIVDAMEIVLRWSHGYTDSKLAIEDAFKKSGKFTQTYTY